MLSLTARAAHVLDLVRVVSLVLGPVPAPRSVGLKRLGGLDHHLGVAVLGNVHPACFFRVGLALDPEVRFLEPRPDRNRGLPPNLLLDHGVVRVAPAHAHGARDVLDGQVRFRRLKRLSNGRKLVHGHHLFRAQVQGHLAVTVHDAQRALHAVVHKHEAPRLLPVAPHLKVVRAADGLAAKRGGRFLPPALPGPLGPVHVVVARHARHDGEVLGVRERHFFRVELLKPVRVLRLGRPRHRLFQAHAFWVQLEVLVVHARRRRVKVARHPVHAGSLEHVEAEHGVVEEQHALVGLNETHPAHVRRQVKHLVAAFGGVDAALDAPQVELLELVAEVLGLHEFVVLPVRADHIPPFAAHTLGQMRPDEAGTASDADFGTLKRRRKLVPHHTLQRSNCSCH
mmetsp:Transcript_46583/g.93993  ORF Transcript_46583/g.93993 Transcript_46583/m.93993 type:complete len:397 (-) Transcript_46583:35-1225(-)